MMGRNRLLTCRRLLPCRTAPNPHPNPRRTKSRARHGAAAPAAGAHRRRRRRDPPPPPGRSRGPLPRLPRLQALAPHCLRPGLPPPLPRLPPRRPAARLLLQRPFPEPFPSLHPHHGSIAPLAPAGVRRPRLVGPRLQPRPRPPQELGVGQGRLCAGSDHRFPGGAAAARYLVHLLQSCGDLVGCDHRDCHGGPFLVVCVGNDDADWAVRACVYSSEARAWGTPDSTYFAGRYIFDVNRAALIGDEIYCIVDLGARILKYDLVKHCFSFIDLPCVYEKYTVLMQNEDGSLGLAGVSGSRLYLWSRMVNPEGVTGWVQQRVFKLKILPKADVFDFAEGAGVFFMSTKTGAFTFELKSGRVRKAGVCRDYYAFFPFISFFTPDYACGKLPLLAKTN